MQRHSEFYKITLYAHDINLKFSTKACDKIEISSFERMVHIEKKLDDINLVLNLSKTKFIKLNLQPKLKLD